MTQPHGGPIRDINAIVVEVYARIFPSLEKIVKKVADSDMLDNADAILKRVSKSGIFGLFRK